MSVRLNNDRLCLEVLPELGGCVVRFDALMPDGPKPLFRPGKRTSRDPNDMGLYPLLPWSNRIASGGFRWRGNQYGLTSNLAGEPLPIHGDGWQQPWDVAHATQDALRLTLRSARQPPFAYRAELDYRLEGESLCIALAVTHLGDAPVPYGVGLHPWLPRTPDTRLEAPAEGVWEVDDAQLPTRWRALDEADPWCFAAGRGLPAGRIDNLFTGWTGLAHVTWPSRGVALAVESDPAGARYLVYSPGADADFFCFEPVSHDVNAHHFADPLAHGLVELLPGGTLSQAWRFTCLAPRRWA
ncbi:aldose 1-epimerase [Billgrantia gudaonensis]|uniref:Aldose 1-epimerase n=1 Tax=Billgrantia gudaonensis TaxID=376427 RepID=A0A1G9CLS9_9GAMM|nr:aldose 1-epimerase [Halomonas gudaonensis]SDK52671.1 aldose 1-epimerase [Halomonas gudaonensis]